jgi:hypothetical protein
MGRHRYASEVDQKSDAQIERETAVKWCERACDCYDRYRETGDNRWLLRGENYRHEALEHAALVADDCKTLVKVAEQIKKHLTRGKR